MKAAYAASLDIRLALILRLVVADTAVDIIRPALGGDDRVQVVNR